MSELALLKEEEVELSKEGEGEVLREGEILVLGRRNDKCTEGEKR